MISKFWDAGTARVLSTIIIFVCVLAFIHGARDTLTLFLFAVLLAYLVAPLVARLETPLRGRVKAIGLVYVTLAGLMIGFGFCIGPRTAEEGKALTQTLPSLLDRMGSGQLVSQVGRRHGWSDTRQRQIQNLFMSHRADLLNDSKEAVTRLADLASHIWWLVLIPILSLFFLKDGSMIAVDLVGFGRSDQEKESLRGIIADFNVMLGSYIRAQLILCTLTLVAYTLVLSLLRVPYAFILGPLAAILEFVPVVGPAVGAISVALIAVLSGYTHIVLLIFFLGAWRLLQDYVNAPRVMGRSLEISPLVQIFGVLAGGEIGGVVGALISVPVIATLRILWRRMASHLPADTPAAATIPERDLPGTPWQDPAPIGLQASRVYKTVPIRNESGQ